MIEAGTSLIRKSFIGFQKELLSPPPLSIYKPGPYADFNIAKKRQIKEICLGVFFVNTKTPQISMSSEYENAANQYFFKLSVTLGSSSRFWKNIQFFYIQEFKFQIFFVCTVSNMPSPSLYS